MNTCILMAEIVKNPELRYTTDNTPVADMLVEFPGFRDEDPSATLKVVGWKNLATEMKEQYRQGEHVVIEGRLGMNTIERPEGFKEKRAELTASRIHRLSAVAPTPSATETVLSEAQAASAVTEAAQETVAEAVPEFAQADAEF